MHGVRTKIIATSAILTSCLISLFTLYAIQNHSPTTVESNSAYAGLFLLAGYFVYENKSEKYGAWLLVLATSAIPILLLMRWGIDFPHGLLLLVFAGVVTVTLVPGRYAALWLAILLGLVVLLGFWQEQVPPSTSWREYTTTGADGVVFSAIVLTIFFVLARFHRQLREAMSRTEQHVEILERERQLLLARDLERATALSELHGTREQDLVAFTAVGRQALKLFHDLAGPLSALATYLDDEKPGPAKSATEAKLKAVKATAQHIGSYVQDVSRSVRGEGTTELVQLAPLASRVVASLAPLALERAITCTVQGRGTVSGNPLGISRALQNLVQNAIEAAATRVEVRIEKHGWRIEDDGPGLARNRTRKVGPGHGLGLLIVRDVLREHGALLEVSSPARGTGTVVRVTFP